MLPAGKHRTQRAREIWPSLRLRPAQRITHGEPGSELCTRAGAPRGREDHATGVLPLPASSPSGSLAFPRPCGTALCLVTLCVVEAWRRWSVSSLEDPAAHRASGTLNPSSARGILWNFLTLQAPKAWELGWAPIPTSYAVSLDPPSHHSEDPEGAM